MRRLMPNSLWRRAKSRKPAAAARGGVPRPWARPAWRRRAMIAVPLAVLMFGFGALWVDGTLSRTAERVQRGLLLMTADAGLVVREVLVEGRAQTDRERLLETLDIRLGDPILGFDPYAARARVEALDWVESASIERRLPDTVIVRLRERRPLALWQRDGKLQLVTTGGRVIANARLERFAALIVIVGADAPENAANLFRLLAVEPEIYARVVAAVRVGGRRWDLRLENGIDVRLPEVDPSRAWRQLAALQREHGLLERDVRAIDLRLPDRIALRLSPAAARRANQPAEDT